MKEREDLWHSLCEFDQGLPCDLFIYSWSGGIVCLVSKRRRAELLRTAGTRRAFGVDDWRGVLGYALELRGIGHVVPDWVIEEIQKWVAWSEWDGGNGDG